MADSRSASHAPCVRPESGQDPASGLALWGGAACSESSELELEESLELELEEDVLDLSWAEVLWHAGALSSCLCSSTAPGVPVA